MMINMKELNLTDRVRAHYNTRAVVTTGGEPVSIIDVAEVAPGVVCVHDNLGEFDLFYDNRKWEIAEEAPEPYNPLLREIRKGAENATPYARDTCAMLVIEEELWNPTYLTEPASFDKAQRAAQAILQLK